MDFQKTFIQTPPLQKSEQTPQTFAEKPWTFILLAGLSLILAIVSALFFWPDINQKSKDKEDVSTSETKQEEFVSDYFKKKVTTTDEVENVSDFFKKEDPFAESCKGGGINLYTACIE